MNACPHCGGTSGYRYSQRERWDYAGSWGKEPIGEYVNTVSTSAARCMDCNRGVKNTDNAEVKPS